MRDCVETFFIGMILGAVISNIFNGMYLDYKGKKIIVVDKYHEEK